jgi:hypothetical protein
VLYAFDASRSIDAQGRRQIALPIAAIAAKRRRPFARTDFEWAAEDDRLWETVWLSYEGGKRR